MSDVLQQAMQNLAYANGLTKAVTIGCAGILVLVMAALWVLALLALRNRVTAGTLLRIVLLFGISFFVAKALNHVISDPRPYILEHIQPLTSVSHDNGFPSDHSLLAAALTASLVWFGRRLIPLFVAATILVMLARLGIAAHHTLDVVGSAAIVFVCAVFVSFVPVPERMRKPLVATHR